MPLQMSKNILINHENLYNFIRNVFSHKGFSDEDATQCADVLILSDLRGIDSHGCARLSGYVRLLELGRANAKPNIKITREKYGTFTIDGDEGLGLVTGPYAMRECIRRCENHGSSWAAVKNSNHFGIGAYHTNLAMEHNFMGMAMTNASPLASPTFSTDRLLGTNPICISIPSGNEKPFVLDMATTTVSNGKLQIAERKGVQVPNGWVQDSKGNPSNDPAELKHGGSLVPLGGDLIHSSYKGYGLGAWVDIFCGVLSGANFGPWVPPFVPYLEPATNAPGEGIGHFFGCWDIEGFMDKEEFGERMDLWIRTFSSANSIEGKKVYIPGEREQSTHKERLSSGIPIQESVIADLDNLSQKLSIKFEV
jgi:L-2-hydroxycarboxylate dehydrogenase (NAD+)